MSMNLLRCVVLVLASCCAALGAQVPVTLTGRIEVAPSGACDPSATHRVACTDILLRSSTVNLGTFAGRLVDLRASTVSTGACNLLEVTEIANAANATTTTSLGGYRLGSTVIFTTPAPVGALVPYFWSTSPGFLPVGEFGSLQLNPLTNFLYWSTDISVTIAVRSVRIPNDPILVGQIALFQTGLVTVTPEISFKLLNAGCFEIRN